MMKKLVLLILIPIFCFSQNTKTDKVLNQVNTAAGVASGVIGLFKKNKNNDNTDNKTDTKGGKTSDQSLKNATSDGTFPLNAKPEDILAKVLKCTYKNFYDEKYCIWQPKSEDFNNTKTLFEDDKERVKYLTDSKQMLATKIDTVISFKQNEVNNIVLGISSYFTDGKEGIDGCNACSVLIGVVRLQSDAGKEMKLANLEKILVEGGAIGSQVVDVLNLDDNNIFYEIKESMAYKGGERYFTARYFDLNGKIITRFNDDGYAADYKTEVDRINKKFKLVYYDESYTKGKMVKTKKTVANFQYGNGTITEIKQPATVKPTVKTTKKK